MSVSQDRTWGLGSGYDVDVGEGGAGQFFWLGSKVSCSTRHVVARGYAACRRAVAYLRDHHMTIKRPTPALLTVHPTHLRAWDVRADLGHHGCTECDVGDEMAVHLHCPSQECQFYEGRAGGRRGKIVRY